MILFTFLLVTLLVLVAITVFAVSAGGAVFIILFGDVIVCAFLIIWLIVRIFKRRRG